jgi:hypothetical protein
MGLLDCYSVCVFVSVLNVLLVDMWVRVSLSVMTVLVLVLDVVMIMQDVRVRMRHVPVRVLMGVLCRGHSIAPFSTVSLRNHIRMDGTLVNRCYTPNVDYWKIFLARKLMRPFCN